jgi:hypothetical protein
MGWIRDLMDVIGWAQETRQRDVETKLAEAELASKQQVLAIATLDDVRQYDPNVRELTARMEAARARPGSWRSSGAAGLAVGLIGTGSALLAFLLRDRPAMDPASSAPPAAVAEPGGFSRPPTGAAPPDAAIAEPGGFSRPPTAAAPDLPQYPRPYGGVGRFSAVHVVGDIYIRSGPGMRYAPIGYVPARSMLVLERPDEHGWSRVRGWTDFVSADGAPMTWVTTGYIYSRSSKLRPDPVQ